ncbi:MAG: hypothetical protein A2041_01990 [Bacteroidetes bacterium GWA2_31_9b]|nr:MAG: hypothetical protein A2041_01990 [Bacteroidetes bacterium GWA2_31_9b]
MREKFNWQIFISIGLLFSFIVMGFSGIVLYMAPEGSVSRWIGWEIIRLSKDQWENQHTIFSYIFIIFSLFHIFKINWDLFFSYFKMQKTTFKYSKEIFLAIIITVLIFIGTVMNFQPFKGIMKIGGNISKSFNKASYFNSVPDVSNTTMQQYAESNLLITDVELKNYLNDLGFKLTDNSITIEEFCLNNNIIPSELNKLLKKKIE